MKNTALVLAAALGLTAWTATAQDQTPTPPAGERPPGQQAGRGGAARDSFHLLPPRALEQLKLTAEQQKQITALEAETKAKLEKILTPEQLQQMKQMRPPQGQGGMGRAGQGGPGGNTGRPSDPPPGADGGNFPPAGAPPTDN